MKWLDLFSGIGAYALGLEQAGHEVIGFCENDVWARKILKKHWPTKPISWCVKSLVRSLLVSSAAGRAKILATRESAPDWKESALDFGGIYLEPFAWYNQKSSSWKTWQRCLEGGWAEYKETWPVSGMTRNGIAYQLPILDWHIRDIGASLWPTPQAKDGQGYYITSYESAKVRQQRGRQLHWIHHALLIQGAEGKHTANPRFSEEMMGLPIGWTDLEESGTATHRASSEI